MLFVRDSKSGFCDDLGKWIMENENEVDKQKLYELERIYNDIDEAVADLAFNEDEDDELDELRSKVNQYETEMAELREEYEDKISDLQEECKLTEEDLDNHLVGAEEVRHLLKELKDLFEGDIVKVSDIIDKVDNIMDEIDNRL